MKNWFGKQARNIHEQLGRDKKPFSERKKEWRSIMENQLVESNMPNGNLQQAAKIHRKNRRK